MTARALVAETTRLLHSFRGAARRLGVGRETIAQLVRDGVLRAVPWGDGVRIPEAELQRLAAEGWTAGATRRPPRSSRRRAGVADPTALLRTKVEDL